MLFKTNLVVLSLFAFNSVNVSASTWPYDKSALLKEVKRTFSEFETKTGFCQELRNRQMTSIESDWLYSLPLKKQRVILSVVTGIVFERCTKQEKDNYTIAVMNYTSETEDKSYLNEWIILNKMHYTQEIFDFLSDVDPKLINQLTERPELYYPFERGAEKYIIPNAKQYN